MKSPKWLALWCVTTAAPAFAATVTVNPVMRSLSSGRDPVPGRPAPFVFRGDNPIQPPSINNAEEIVFRARSASNADNNVGAAFGIYAKRPGFPLAVLVDSTDTSGAPSFPVPGRPAGTRFGTFSPPLLNNAGNVIFSATFSIPGVSTGSGSGLYSVNVTGGTIVRITDTFSTVPGHPTATFRNFSSGFSGVLIAAALNDAGQVVYWADFLIPPAVFPNVTNAIFGTSVAGGAGILLADSTQTISPVSVPIGANAGFREIRPTLSINSGGSVAFAGGLGPAPSLRAGVFVVSVTGGPIETAAFRGQPVPGRALNFTDTFDPAGNTIDINDSGVVLFRNNPTGAEFGNYAATPSGGAYVHTRILDTLGGIPIPGETVPPAEFSGNSPPKFNDAGQMGVYSFVINSPTPNQQGIFATDTDGSPFTLVANLLTAPPGLTSPPARFNNFLQENAAINDLGNMTFRATGNVTITPAVGFNGLYFYDVCTPELVRISDSTLSLSQLGGTFSTGNYDLWQVESAAGQHRSINNDNDVAFSAQFSNLEYGVYIARITTGSGGQLNIECPDDIVAECPADTDPSATGSATATGCGTITVTSSDSVVPGCGNTYTITRTWTADNGSTTASCDQSITVADTTGPVLSGVPDKASAECGSVPPPAAVTASDGCHGDTPVVLSESSAEGPCAGTYILTRDWISTDACGNSSTGSHQICVLDSLDPGLMGVPGDVTVECDAVPAPAIVTGADQCDPVVDIAFVENTTPGICPDNYVLSRSWTATDECANDVTGTQLITVQDTTAPSIICPPHISMECPGNTSIGANGTASGSDNCGGASIAAADTQAAGCGTTQTITRSWSASDDCGNSAACDQLVAIVDTTPPVLSVSSNSITVTDTNCDGSQAATLPSSSATDACDGARPVTNNAPPSYPTGTTNVTLTAADACGNSSSSNVSVKVKYGANIIVHAKKYVVGVGTRPTVSVEPLVNIYACAYNQAPGSCPHTVCGGLFFHRYECIVDNCTPTACGYTDSNGRVTLNLPPGDYVIASQDVTGLVLPDALGCWMDDLDCGETNTQYLVQIELVQGPKRPCRVTRFTGSELLVIEPEYVIWDDTEQLYPFVFQSIGDWGVTASVTPPEGFVADHDSLSAEVDDELEAVQFVITEVGSDLVPTQTHFDIVHKGERKTLRSSVGILLTPDYARSRGFDVDKLRDKKLIVEPEDRTPGKKRSNRADAR